MNPNSECVACQGPAIEVGHYAGVLCVPCALVAAGVRPKDRSAALAAHEAAHRAFKARNRHLEDLGPVRAAQGPTVVAPPDADTMAAVLTLLAVGAKPVRVERRYGDLPPTVTPITVDHDPLNPCGLCGTTSTRTKRAPFGVAPHVWVWCVAQDACMARLRKAKAA